MPMELLSSLATTTFSPLAMLNHPLKRTLKLSECARTGDMKEHRPLAATGTRKQALTAAQASLLFLTSALVKPRISVALLLMQFVTFIIHFLHNPHDIFHIPHRTLTQTLVDCSASCLAVCHSIVHVNDPDRTVAKGVVVGERFLLLSYLF